MESGGAAESPRTNLRLVAVVAEECARWHASSLHCSPVFVSEPELLVVNVVNVVRSHADNEAQR